ARPRGVRPPRRARREAGALKSAFVGPSWQDSLLKQRRSAMLTRWIRLSAAAVLVFFAASPSRAQGVGTITGTVVDQVTGRPIAGAQVHIPGTQIGQITNDAGRFLLLNVPVGTVRVRVQFLGYAAVEREVTVRAGEVATLDLAMTQEVIAMDEVVVTALGIPRTERGLGYAVQSVNSQQLDVAPQLDVVSVLQGK